MARLFLCARHCYPSAIDLAHKFSQKSLARQDGYDAANMLLNGSGDETSGI